MYISSKLIPDKTKTAVQDWPCVIAKVADSLGVKE